MQAHKYREKFPAAEKNGLIAREMGTGRRGLSTAFTDAV